jgi:hypothetical protein
LTPALNAQVYAMRRSPSTSGPVVVLLTTLPAVTRDRCDSRNERHAGLMTAMPGVEPATGLRHAVALAFGPTGNVPVIAGEVTCVVSYASVGANTDRCMRVCSTASC